MKRLALALTALVALSCLAFAGCGNVETTINFSDDYTSISAKDKTLTLDLIGNPSTGYEWTCETADESILKESAHETKETAKADDASEQMVGLPVTEHYTFDAAHDGVTTLTAKYARSWEETPDDLEYVYSVTVKDGKITDVSVESQPTFDEITDDSTIPIESVLTEADAAIAETTSLPAAGTDA